MHLLEKKRPESDSSTSAKTIAYSNNKILLLQNSDNTWELPGGHVKKGEPLIAGAIREFFEEAGIKIYSLDKIKSKTNRIIYKTKLSSTNVKLSKEHKRFMFVPVNNIYKMNLSKRAYDDLSMFKRKKKKKDEEEI